MDCVDFSPFTLSPPLQRGEEPTAAQRKVANQLDDCFRNFGALYLTNIGITKEELAESFDVMKTLFAMPEEDKLEKLKPLEQVTNTGYLRSGCESLNPRRSPDMKEVRPLFALLL